ncbi:MAG: hypothetical protein HYV04_09235, partial [Deltaproteobacteria bacterium]|nr:hypothetical protein [Deltaproteobacteria bacterium]
APPGGVVTARVNPDTGLRVTDGQPGIVDFFYQEFMPTEDGVASAGLGGDSPSEEVRNQLF